jgi:hypothetical protein
MIRPSDPDCLVCLVDFNTLIEIQSDAERLGSSARWTSVDGLRGQVKERDALLRMLMREKREGVIRSYRCLLLFSAVDGATGCRWWRRRVGTSPRQRKAMVTSKGSDSMQDDISDSITITPAQFAVVGQLTYELPNMPPDRLSAYGLSKVDVEYLTSMMRAFRRIDEQYAQARFDIVDTEDASLRGGRSADVHIEAHGNELVAVVALRREVAAGWSDALDSVTSWLGDRELFLRTGFHSGEAREAIFFLHRSR